MVDAFNFTNPTIIIADRGYESFNVYEHIKKSGQKFLIRVKDTKSNGLLKGLRFPSKGTFDTELTLQLTRRRTNEVKADKRYQYIRKTASFDYLPLQSKESYPINFRVVRIKLSEDLKTLYHLRWGIETSFRELKYALGLTHFHSKKLDFIIQEIYARLIMYNFSMGIALVVTVPDHLNQSYQINFTQAIGICKRFFLCHSVNVELLIKKYLLPIRSKELGEEEVWRFFISHCLIGGFSIAHSHSILL